MLPPPRHGLPSLLALAAVATLAACRTLTDADAPFPLSTDRVQYAATRLSGSEPPQYAFTIIARLRNAAASPIYLETCAGAPRPIYGIELVDGQGRDGSAFDPSWACPGAAPLLLAPGAERVDTLRLQGPTGFDGSVAPPQPLGAVSGRMRLIYAGRTCRAAGGCGPESAPVAIEVRSSIFAVVAAP